ncbi:UNKNOWN [Stylonychia lemnae]|uniref:Uncharacterized protein n=1 Tax=Stylonychia lemnae TaxID=5949 RepID=A0A078B5X9_STYLE|nr:UNKNOWN [Stylonychia lemnae]|eukprot:CDW89915.1 UNKNOWN [Stylonychia lemnae]
MQRQRGSKKPRIEQIDQPELIVDLIEQPIPDNETIINRFGLAQQLCKISESQILAEFQTGLLSQQITPVRLNGKPQESIMDKLISNKNDFLPKNMIQRTNNIRKDCQLLKTAVDKSVLKMQDFIQEVENGVQSIQKFFQFQYDKIKKEPLKKDKITETLIDFSKRHENDLDQMESQLDLTTDAQICQLPEEFSNKTYDKLLAQVSDCIYALMTKQKQIDVIHFQAIDQDKMVCNLAFGNGQAGYTRFQQKYLSKSNLAAEHFKPTILNLTDTVTSQQSLSSKGHIQYTRLFSIQMNCRSQIRLELITNRNRFQTISQLARDQSSYLQKKRQKLQRYDIQLELLHPQFDIQNKPIMLQRKRGGGLDYLDIMKCGLLGKINNIPNDLQFIGAMYFSFDQDSIFVLAKRQNLEDVETVVCRMIKSESQSTAVFEIKKENSNSQVKSESSTPPNQPGLTPSKQLLQLATAVLQQILILKNSLTDAVKRLEYFMSDMERNTKTIIQTLENKYKDHQNLQNYDLEKKSVSLEGISVYTQKSINNLELMRLSISQQIDAVNVLNSTKFPQLDMPKEIYSNGEIVHRFNERSMRSLNNLIDESTSKIFGLHAPLNPTTNTEHTELLCMEKDSRSNEFTLKRIKTFPKKVNFIMLHQERLICEDLVYSFAEDSKFELMQDLNQQDISAGCAISDSLVVFGHCQLAKISIWKFVDMKYYMIQKQGLFSGSMYHNFVVTKMKKDEYSPESNSIYGVFGGNNISRVTFNGKNIKETQKTKICGKSYILVDYKIMSAECQVSQHENGASIRFLDCSTLLQSVNDACDDNQGSKRAV